jgi:hypothetical protein
MDTSASNLWIYRDGRQHISGRKLVTDLRNGLEELTPTSSQDALLAVLLRAGEMECALDDARWPGAHVAAKLTDLLALALVGRPMQQVRLREASRRLVGEFPAELTVSRPEGFAYYALHPLDFADLLSQINLSTGCAFVVGIRSIGTTLSAIVAACLSEMGVSADRSTVRPLGHPYGRTCRFSLQQRQAIAAALSRGADFLVCDEGPGRSGSSFLSVAEALEGEGVPRDRITLLCSHQPQIDRLCADGAPQRWRRYKSLATGMTRRLPCEAGEYLGGGQWRRVLIPNADEWPASWPQMERLKYLARDGGRIWTFQGHGHYGEIVHQREQLLSGSGFGVSYLGWESGFGGHELVTGAQLNAKNVSRYLLRRLAEYCAWRPRAFPASVSGQEARQLESMVTFNVEAEFGRAPDVSLDLVRPVICDGRMHPTNWRRSKNSWLKFDGSMHGDDHFFPGPTDIAWDLAGVCIEWQLTPEARAYFLDEYIRISGDNPGCRIADYEVAYSAFRLAWSKMAAASMSGTDEAPRLWKEHSKYRATVSQLLNTRQEALAVSPQR